jgi:hypothetical protein
MLRARTEASAVNVFKPDWAMSDAVESPMATAFVIEWF